MTSFYNISSEYYLWEIIFKDGKTLVGCFVSPSVSNANNDLIHYPIYAGKDFAFCPRINLPVYNNTNRPLKELPNYIQLFNRTDVARMTAISI